MRFRFCGGLDCPDWVLAEITILARMSSIKMKLLSAQVVKQLLGTDLDYEKVKKYTSDAKYDSGDVKAIIAVLSFIISSAAKYDVDSTSLNDELQQLGLPKEHSSSLCKLFADSSADLQNYFKIQSLRLSEIEDVSWEVRHSLSQSSQHVLQEPLVDLTITTKESQLIHQTLTFTMTATKLQVLLFELKQAREAMQATDSGP